MLRGAVYSAFLPHVGEAKLYVIVSNNGRNRALGTALAARITTSNKPPLDSIVPIDPNEIVHGRVLCDDIELIYPEDIRERCGAFSRPMMRKIDDGLRAAFDV
ncbi:type II toxin-antitoxin system PemK/MazF family toxin [Mycolicibacterium sp. XJ647]